MSSPIEERPRLSLPLTAEGYAAANEAFRIDVSACFEPDSALGKHLLDFLLQADMQRAPGPLRQRVLKALAELSRAVGGRRLLPHPSGVFTVTASTGS